MTRAELARLLDHSVLKPEATLAEVHAGADIVRTWRIGCYCVQSGRVRASADALAGTDALVASVVGFPHGCERTDVKASAAALAIDDGAREIDMVMNLGAMKDGALAVVAADIATVVRASGDVPVKVILEAAALGDDEKRIACRIAADAGAAFVKTSTGFHPAGGATVADVRLMRAAVGAALGVKASGGIRTLAEALAMVGAGANRIGTSASATILSALG
ncbi:MAG: deoxyribose-phosphate aldolase [Betaproteobacteria bacterium]